jgi:hypothetical protein
MENTKSSTTSTNTSSPWDLDSGLIDKVSAKIVDAIFGTDPNYQNGEVPLLKLTLESPDIDPTVVSFSLGKDWEIRDQGERIENVKGKFHINASSVYGKFIARVHDEMKVPMPDTSTPLLAKTWVGFSFFWEREEFTYKGLLDEKGGKTTHLMPSQYLPEFDAGNKAKAPALEIPPEIEKTLAAYALTSPDFATFFKAAWKLPELKALPEVLNKVMREDAGGYYETHPHPAKTNPNK